MSSSPQKEHFQGCLKLYAENVSVTSVKIKFYIHLKPIKNTKKHNIFLFLENNKRQCMEPAADRLHDINVKEARFTHG